MIANHNSKNKKKLRVKIRNERDFREFLKAEGIDTKGLNEEKIGNILLNKYAVNEDIYLKIKECIKDKNSYRVLDIYDFIDYMEKIIIFEKNHNTLCDKIRELNEFYIDRIEFEREPVLQDEVSNLIKIVEEMKLKSKEDISEEELKRLTDLENEISLDYLYAKDIEFLKNMFIKSHCELEENYNEESNVKRLSIKMKNNIGYNYVKAKKGTVEYHDYLNSSIPRMKRLINNMHRYMENENGIVKINQSDALQDSINIAVVDFNGREFKAISGGNEIKGYCKAPKIEEQAFKSMKVNKLGKLGIGYNRINDSEKKIFEEIHRLIEKEELESEGELTLYSKWEPCQSCYLVINQFSKKYTNIDIRIKYWKSYGVI